MAMPIAPAATAAPTIALAPPVTIAAAAPALETVAAVVVEAGAEDEAEVEPKEDGAAAVLDGTDLAEAPDVDLAIVVSVAVASVFAGTARVAGATLGRSLFKILESPCTRLVSMARNWEGT